MLDSSCSIAAGPAAKAQLLLIVRCVVLAAATRSGKDPTYHPQLLPNRFADHPPTSFQEYPGRRVASRHISPSPNTQDRLLLCPRRFSTHRHDTPFCARWEIPGVRIDPTPTLQSKKGTGAPWTCNRHVLPLSSPVSQRVPAASKRMAAS